MNLQAKHRTSKGGPTSASRVRLFFGLGSFLLLAGPILRASPVAQYALPQRMTIPGEIVFTDDGQGWISTWEAGIFRLDPNAGVSKVAQSSRGYRFMVLGPDRAVWTAGTFDLWRIDPVTGALALVQTGDYIDALATGPDGALWLLRRDNAHVFRISRMNAAGAPLSAAITDLPLVDGGRGGVVAGDEALWTLYGNSIIKIYPNGQTSNVPIPFTAYWIFAARDFVWIFGADQHSIAKVSLTGEVLARYRMENPFAGGTVDVDANLWLIEEHTERLARVSPSGEVTPHGSLGEPEVDPKCEYGLPVPMSTTPDGRVAFVRWYWEDNNFQPYGQCRADLRAIDSVFLIVPSQHSAHEIPALSLIAMAAAVFAMGVASIWRLRF